MPIEMQQIKFGGNLNDVRQRYVIVKKRDWPAQHLLLSSGSPTETRSRVLSTPASRFGFVFLDGVYAFAKTTSRESSRNLQRNERARLISPSARMRRAGSRAPVGGRRSSAQRQTWPATWS